MSIGDKRDWAVGFNKNNSNNSSLFEWVPLGDEEGYLDDYVDSVAADFGEDGFVDRLGYIESDPDSDPDTSDEELRVVDGVVREHLVPDSKFVLRIKDSFEFHQVLGSGREGVCFAAREKATGARVALKQIRKESVVPKKLLREIEILRLLGRYESVVSLLGVYETSEYVYLVMELAFGGDVFQFLRTNGGRLNIESSRTILRLLLEGVSDLHEEGIVHRDIKPANMLLKTEGDPSSLQIADLGHAKVLRNNTRATTVCGTFAYVAPEVLATSNRNYTQAADMWSVGVTAFLLVTGELPFPAQAERIREGVVRYHPSFRTEEYAPVRDFIRQLLVVDPEGRMSAKQALLHSWIQGEACMTD